MDNGLAKIMVCLAVVTSLLAPEQVRGADGEAAPWPEISVVPVAEGLRLPVQVTHAGDGSGRLFILEQDGRVRIAGRGGSLLERPFLDISGRVSRSDLAMGLLGIAFPPSYAEKGEFYVNYTNRDDDTVIARYHVTANPNVADPGSEEILLTIPQPYRDHKGGQIMFGPRDGYLYIGMGDGGFPPDGPGDPENRAQNPGSLLGKLLRVDVESGQAPYAIPPANPYTQTKGYRGEIWALGLRNPWRFSFDRGTGDLWIGDVGHLVNEEINFQPASSRGGENYGWRILEGHDCYNPPEECEPPRRYTPPLITYTHERADCAVTGGVVYRGRVYPRMQGLYFYSDSCSGRIWAARKEGSVATSKELWDGHGITSFGEDEDGEIYVTEYITGKVYRITDAVTGWRLYLPTLGTNSAS